MLYIQYVEISVPATTIAVLIVHDDNNSMLTLIVHYIQFDVFVRGWLKRDGIRARVRVCVCERKHKARTTRAKLFDFDPTNIHLNIQLVHLILFLSSFIRTSGWREEVEKSAC